VRERRNHGEYWRVTGQSGRITKLRLVSVIEHGFDDVLLHSDLAATSESGTSWGSLFGKLAGKAPLGVGLIDLTPGHTRRSPVRINNRMIRP
jgi:hypothetical protein